MKVGNNSVYFITAERSMEPKLDLTVGNVPRMVRGKFSQSFGYTHAAGNIR